MEVCMLSPNRQETSSGPSEKVNVAEDAADTVAFLLLSFSLFNFFRPYHSSTSLCHRVSNTTRNNDNKPLVVYIFAEIWCCVCRPGFLPDPNDGSLYVLGGKHMEGLMVKKPASVCICRSMCVCTCVLCQLSLWPHCLPLDASTETAIHHPRAGAVSSLQELWWYTVYRWVCEFVLMSSILQEIAYLKECSR